MTPSTLGLILLAALAVACGPGPAPAAPPSPPSHQIAAPTPARIDGHQHVGDPAAAVVLVYWFDYQCPYCLAFGPTLDQLERFYGDQIVVHYKNFQLDEHPDSRSAAIAAEAARRQGKFIEMHRFLVATSPRFSPAELRQRAAELGLDLTQFDADVRDPEAAAAVDRQVAEGERAGLQYVPALLINDVEYTFDLDLAGLSAAIDARLAEGR